MKSFKNGMDLYELTDKNQLKRNGKIVKRKFSELRFELLIDDLKQNNWINELIK